MNGFWRLLALGSMAAVLISLSGRTGGASPGKPEPAAPAKEERPLTALPYTPSLDLSSMDRSANPCVDFYAYACGGWMKNNPIPADQASWSVYAKLGDENQRFLWGALEDAARPRKDRSAVEQKIGDYFAACMNQGAVEKAGVGPIQPSLDAIARLGSVAELPELLGREHQVSHGSGLLFDWNASQDFADSEQVIAFASAGGLGLPDRDYYVKTDAKSVETLKRYQAHVAELLQLLGESAPVAQAHAKQVLQLETRLARASLSRVDRRDPYKLFHKMSLAQLQALTPAFQWGRYISQLGLPSLGAVNVTEPEFFKQMQTLLTSTDLDSWKAYLRWHVAHDMAPYLSSRFVDADFGFYSSYLRGVTAQRPRWKRCVNWVDRDLGEALGQVFVQKTFGPEVKQRTVSMTEGIEKAMEAEINALSWMGSDTKRQALGKLHKMVNKVGYPERWRDYSSVQIKPDDFSGNVRRAAVFESRRQLAKIGRPIDRGEWGMTPPTVNAYYDPQMNDINFPAGVLQPPLFDFKLDDAPNYGNTGATIGHELTHGFDDEGRQFDGAGNLKNWWSKKDASAFEQRASCVVDQYAQYTIVDDIKINSKLTLGEDVADLGGTVLAYKAWKRVVDRQLPRTDGLSPDQRFFVGMAQWACENQRPENERVNAVTNPHSPGRYRVNGVVANMPEFGTAFSCTANQPMVRAKPCKVW